MLRNHLQQPEIEPFEFQNRSNYRDLLRLLTSVREFQINAKTDLSKKILGDFFNTLSLIAKEIAYSTIDESNTLFTMELLVNSILKTFDCMASLDICFEARWIPSVQYFEAKQILEKTYWAFKSQQQFIVKTLGSVEKVMSPAEKTH